MIIKPDKSFGTIAELFAKHDLRGIQRELSKNLLFLPQVSFFWVGGGRELTNSVV
jgi:hypothetical protein